MSGMITTITASNDKELKRKIEEIRIKHVAMNPNFTVKVNIINPKEENIEYKSYEATSVTVGITLEELEEE
ncbi:hypothetical protein A2U94_13750 [Bacillus sp. VT 712]|uniref:hypothetical protein n=1 Tax=Bacillaceae TaxID=186817 RepID=UPI000473B44F|nr:MULTISPECIES: hypothetical protein [Bacillaceae]KZB90907.1 hypothetical protein A2U94_13750 [Bacillus sp. VT 712]